MERWPIDQFLDTADSSYQMGYCQYERRAQTLTEIFDWHASLIRRANHKPETAAPRLVALLAGEPA